MEIEGNLIIRGFERGKFEVRFVPADPGTAPSTATLTVPNVEGLQRVLTRLGLEWDRIVQIESSPYVLQSLRLRLNSRAARRAGLIPTPLGRALGLLARCLRPARRPP